MSYSYSIPTRQKPVGQKLGDYPFKQVIMTAFGSDYDRDIATLTSRLNANAGWGCAIIQGSACYRTDEVEKVVSVYVNQVKKKTIPEYEREGKAVSAIPQIEQLVGELSGVNPKRVAAVLYELYYGIKDGSLKLDRLLWPETAEQNEEQRQSDEPSINTGSFSTVVRYAVPIAIGVGVVYGLSTFTNLASSIKQLVKD